MMSTYLPDVQVQLNPADPLGHLGCTAYAGAVALDYHTHGLVRVSGRTIREHQDDNEGGIGLDDVAVAWDRIGGWTFGWRRGADWGYTRSLLDVGRGIVLQGVYGNLPSGERCSRTFVGPHAIYVQGPALPGPNGSQRRVWDPLCGTVHAIEEVELRRYAEGLGGGIWVGWTQAHKTGPEVDITGRYFSYNLVRGKITGRSAHNKPSGFPKPTGEPITRAWPGQGTRRLVQIQQAGSSYDGWWVEPAAGSVRYSGEE